MFARSAHREILLREGETDLKAQTQPCFFWALWGEGRPRGSLGGSGVHQITEPDPPPLGKRANHRPHRAQKFAPDEKQFWGEPVCPATCGPAPRQMKQPPPPLSTLVHPDYKTLPCTIPDPYV